MIVNAKKYGRLMFLEKNLLTALRIFFSPMKTHKATDSKIVKNTRLVNLEKA